MSTKVALFDLDGTLMTARNKGPRAEESRFVETLRRYYGKKVRLEFVPDGSTDLLILRDLITRNGLERPDLTEEGWMLLLKRLEPILAAAYAERLDRYNIISFPGVREILSELRGRGVVIGLVTGAIRDTAKLKLQQIGVAEFFQVIACGSDNTDRTKLIRLAISKAETLVRFQRQPGNIFYFGDTPRDVVAGRNAGVTTIIVTTGSFKPDQFTGEHAPDLLIPNFEVGTADVLKRMSLS